MLAQDKYQRYTPEEWETKKAQFREYLEISRRDFADDYGEIHRESLDITAKPVGEINLHEWYWVMVKCFGGGVTNS